MSNQKGFSKVAAVIIIALILIGGAYFVYNKNGENIPTQNTENESSQSSQSVGGDLSMNEWKTYKNEKYGLEFKYPADWKIQEYKSENIDNGITIGIDPLETISKLSYETLDMMPGLIMVSLGRKNPFNVLEKGYFESLEKSEVGQGINARKIEEKTGENEPNPYYFNRHMLTYYFGNKINYFESYAESDFTVKYVSDLNDQYLKIFNQILSTFKITH